MPDWLTTLGGITDAVGKLFGTGYNMYTNQRDFDYQRDLQQQMFQREDTAVQRRMQDLQAAGLNPNLAAGSAAQAGGVVSRSNTNDLNIGSMLDSIAAINQIKLQKQQTHNAQIEGDILDNQKSLNKLKSDYEKMQIYHKLGFDVTPTYDGFVVRTDRFGYPIDDNNNYVIDYPFKKEFDESLKNLENSNKYLEKELKFQTADHIADYIKSGTGLLKFIK